jgi:aspartate aminotransferase
MAASMKISRVVSALAPSATLAMAAKAREVKASGRAVYDFSLGEPDFITPQHICDAATAAMAKGHTHYTPSGGIPELRAAIAAQYRQRHGLEFAPQQVVVSNGAKHALHNAFAVLCDPGDEVVIPAPYWVSYAELVKLTGARPVIVATRPENDFKLTAEALRSAISNKTTLLLLCSPSNPTGAVYTAQELAALADVVLERGLMVVADEIYERLLYEGHAFASFATLRKGLAERTVLVNGCSKAYAMTGWRIGWTISPSDVARAIDNLQSQETSNASSISQYAALAAITGPQDCVETMRRVFAERRDFVRRRIAAIEGLSCTEMGGAFYAFVRIADYLGRRYGTVRLDDSAAWCLELLAQEGVAAVMGSAFGAEGYIRISYATSLDVLEQGFDRIEKFFKQSVPAG